VDDAGGEGAGREEAREEEGGGDEEEGSDLVRARAERLLVVVRWHCSPFVGGTHGRSSVE